VAVNSLGKWKTATQMAAITALLGSGSAGAAAAGVAAAGIGLLWVSAGLALASLGIYMRDGLPHMLK
jgi:CDP-diacylglycerol--glycerol-3-phosphate 3-phosphatidyltransferase